ncbi:hypothetical protein MRX96_031888 [Rhipicephalus microplus]
MSNAESSTKPLQRTGHVATAYKNGVLVWGGYRETERTTIYLPGNELWFYDTLLEKWTPRSLAGGHPTGHVRVQLPKLDLTTLTWELVDAQGDLPIPCDKMAGWTYRDCLYVFGGFGISPRAGVQRPADFVFLHDMQAPWRGWSNQLVAFNTQTNSWSWPMYKGTAPVARAAHAAARIDGQVFIFGGRHQQSRLNDIHRLDLATMHWTGALRTIGEKPRGRSWHSFTALPPFRIVLYGGFSQTEEPLSDCWLFVVPALTWVRVERDGIQAEDTVITLSFSPRSLYRICLERALRLRHVLQSQLDGS